MNDMSQVIIPKSDQINADDLIAGPMTITIRDVQIKGGQEQPVSILFDGSDKAFRPCKSMSRVLVQAWGADAKAYIGRSVTLYRDPEVKWGGLAVGGIRISHMSHIDGPKQMMLTATKGSRKPHKVLPIVQQQPQPAPAQDFSGQLAELKALARPGNMDALGAKWQEIGADARKALAAELPALKAACTVPVDDVPFDAETGEVAQPPVDKKPEVPAPVAEAATQLETAADEHPAKAAADKIIAEIEKPETNAEMDVGAILARYSGDISFMPEDQQIRIEIAADKRRGEIRAQQEKAKAGGDLLAGAE